MYFNPAGSRGLPAGDALCVSRHQACRDGLERSCLLVLGCRRRVLAYGVLVALAVCVCAQTGVSAQVVSNPETASAPFRAASILRALAPTLPEASTPGQDGPAEALRACPGCPERHLFLPYLESTGLNVLYNIGNRARGHETAKIGPSSWYSNLKHGFEWDTNPFGVNQFGHPYQGNNYFTAGRANGLSFWESTPVAAFGSATWEYFFENNRASLNDLINTTLGGIALGEVLYRTAWLLRDTEATGGHRLTREIIAAAVDPMTGVTRFATGDASRIVEKPPSLIPSTLAARVSAGALWQGSSARSAQSTARPYLDLDLRYGDILTGRTHVPYEAFVLNFTAGGGSAISEMTSRGRFYGRPFGREDQYQFTVVQTFDYVVNRAYVFGGQGFEAEVAVHPRPDAKTKWRLAASSGVSALAAVDSLIPPPDGEDDPGTVFVDPESRVYDYGPGFRIGGEASVEGDGWWAATLTYYLRHVAVVDGFRSNHVLQRLFLDLRFRLPDRIGVGVVGEYFFRKAYFWRGSERTDQSPQFRVYISWSSS